MKSNIIDTFDCLKKSFFKEVNNIFKNALLQPSAENEPDHYWERLISHLEEQIILWDELKEKDELIHSLLEKLPKFNDTVKISQELSKSNTKSFEKKLFQKKIKLKIQQHQRQRKTDYID